EDCRRRQSYLVGVHCSRTKETEIRAHTTAAMTCDTLLYGFAGRAAILAGDTFPRSLGVHEFAYPSSRVVIGIDRADRDSAKRSQRNRIAGRGGRRDASAEQTGQRIKAGQVGGNGRLQSQHRSDPALRRL